MSFSTHVKVMPPSLLLSLNRSRKVPGGLVLRIARSRSLLMKPMMYLGSRKRGEVRLPEQGLNQAGPGLATTRATPVQGSPRGSALTQPRDRKRFPGEPLPKAQPNQGPLGQCSPFIPQRQDVLFHQVNDVVQPDPEGEAFASHVLLRRRARRL